MQRLKTRTQFQAVLKGATLARSGHFVLHRCSLDAPAADANLPSGSADAPFDSDRPQARPAKPLFSVNEAWLGAMVPKRWARRAVTRNAIKRQIYNLAGAYEASLPVAAYVVRLRSGFDRKQFVSASSERLKQAVRVELTQLFERAGAAARAHAPPGSP
ncbi:Ribonuclease P protein component [Burkholderiales bacterium 8X]|nr:Ribonuclease P protein component [Burkholderiales bacterium 8X]